MVVEDDPVQRQYIERMMRRAGHEVVGVGSGEDAIMKIAEQPDFDLVMMDVRMPGIDGVEATRRIRAAGGRGAEIPIVAMSAAQPPESVVQKGGVDGFVQKNELTSGVVEVMLGEMMKSIHTRVDSRAPTPSPDAAQSGGVLLPFPMIVGLVFAVPAAVASAAWYMGTQNAEASHAKDDTKLLAAAVTAQRAELASQIEAQGAIIRTAAEALARVDQRLTALSQANIDDQRRIDAIQAGIDDHNRQLQAERERVGVLDAQIKFIADSLKQRR